MSTRYTNSPIIDVPDDFDLPSCGIEDVDRALFKLFEDDIPFVYESNGEINRKEIIISLYILFGI